MANKLREYFDPNYIMSMKIHFKNPEAKRSFDETLKKSLSDGNEFHVDGSEIEWVDTSLCSGNSKYPIDKMDHITDIIAKPAIRRISIILDIDGSKKEVFLSGRGTDNIVFEYEYPDVVKFEFIIDKENTETVKINYQIFYNKAGSATDIIEGCTEAIALLNRFFKAEGYDAVADINKQLKTIRAVFCKLKAIENVVPQSEFCPQKIKNFKKEATDIEELYYMLIDSRPIKRDGKVKSNGELSQDAGYESPEVGADLGIVFRDVLNFTIAGVTLKIYCANLIYNAIVKEVVSNAEGHTQIVYGGTDSKPMCWVYKGFLNEQDAIDETKYLMDNKEKYVNAKTASEYVTEELRADGPSENFV